MNKRGVMWQELAPWLIGLAIFVIIVFLLWKYGKLDFNFLNKIFDLFRFRS